MSETTMALWVFGSVFGFFILVSFIKIIKQYERGIRFTLGKYSGIMNPGLNFLIPLIQTYRKVDIRQTTIDLPAQEVMTKDKVNLRIDGVIFYSVENPEKVILNIESLRDQIIGKATSELKEIIGGLTMSESLEKRDVIARTLQKYLDESILDKEGGKGWGIKVRAIQINNIELPKELVRAMSKQAEAEREKEARVTKAQGELEASKRFQEAAKVYNNPAALRLRELQTYQEIGTEKNTLMMVIPETMANPLGNWVLPYGSKMIEKTKEKINKNLH